MSGTDGFPKPLDSPKPAWWRGRPAQGAAAGAVVTIAAVLTVLALSGSTVTLTASGGPVSWSISESAGLVGQLTVAPGSGRLLAGQSATVSVRVNGGVPGLAARAGTGIAAEVCVGCQLIVNPGGITVTVVIQVDVIPSSPSSPPPSSQSPPPETAGRRAG
jgi:hypothetical protein